MWNIIFTRQLVWNCNDNNDVETQNSMCKNINILTFTEDGANTKFKAGVRGSQSMTVESLQLMRKFLVKYKGMSLVKYLR